MKRIFWMIQAVLFYCLTLIPTLIPARRISRSGAAVGTILSRILPKRRHVAVDNINQALPYMKTHPLWDASCQDAERLARKSFENLGRSLLEACRLYHGQGDELISRIELRGRDNFEAALARGKGMLCFTGHCGNWELMALTFSSLLGEGAVVARRQNNPYFNRMVERMRMRYNSRVIYKQGGLRSILTTLKKGHLVGMLADQAVFPAEGALIDMLGRKAWASKAPVIIAQKSGAPLVPVFIHREGELQVITFYPEHHFSGDMSDEGVRKETQALSRYVENFVVAHPTEWYWIHRRWKRAGESIA